MRWLAAVLALWLWGAPARAESVHEALDAYALYQSDVSVLLDMEIDSAAAIDDALERGSRHDPARVARGWIAYGALTAAQSPAFVAGVQSRVRAAGRAPVLRQLRRDLTYARRRPPGSAQAIGLILASVAADSARIDAAGRRFEAIGGTLDAASWIVSSERGARELRLRRVGDARLTAAMAQRLHVGARRASAPCLTTHARANAWRSNNCSSVSAHPLRSIRTKTHSAWRGMGCRRRARVSARCCSNHSGNRVRWLRFNQARWSVH